MRTCVTRPFDRHWLCIRRSPRPLDVVRVGDPAAPILSTPDGPLLVWAAAEDRILISLDERTLQSALRAFVLAGHTSPGIVILRGGLSATDVVALLEMLTYDTRRADWENACQWLP
jgi:hypothetical protein